MCVSKEMFKLTGKVEVHSEAVFDNAKLPSHLP